MSPKGGLQIHTEGEKEVIFIYAGIMTAATVFGIGVVIWCREEIKKIEEEEKKEQQQA